MFAGVPSTMFKEGGELLLEGNEGFSKTLNLNLERKNFLMKMTISL